jgi:hypothetical protein
MATRDRSPATFRRALSELYLMRVGSSPEHEIVGVAGLLPSCHLERSSQCQPVSPGPDDFRRGERASATFSYCSFMSDVGLPTKNAMHSRS